MVKRGSRSGVVDGGGWVEWGGGWGLVGEEGRGGSGVMMEDEEGSVSADHGLMRVYGRKASRAAETTRSEMMASARMRRRE